MTLVLPMAGKKALVIGRKSTGRRGRPMVLQRRTFHTIYKQSQKTYLMDKSSSMTSFPFAGQGGYGDIFRHPKGAAREEPFCSRKNLGNAVSSEKALAFRKQKECGGAKK